MTKMNIAVEIVSNNLKNGVARKNTIVELMNHPVLQFKKPTASTYYQLAVAKLNKATEVAEVAEVVTEVEVTKFDLLDSLVGLSTEQKIVPSKRITDILLEKGLVNGEGVVTGKGRGYMALGSKWKRAA
jgi:hypothetical protein